MLHLDVFQHKKQPSNTWLCDRMAWAPRLLGQHHQRWLAEHVRHLALDVLRMDQSVGHGRATGNKPGQPTFKPLRAIFSLNSPSLLHNTKKTLTNHIFINDIFFVSFIQWGTQRYIEWGYRSKKPCLFCKAPQFTWPQCSSFWGRMFWTEVQLLPQQPTHPTAHMPIPCPWGQPLAHISSGSKKMKCLECKGVEIYILLESTS